MFGIYLLHCPGNQVWRNGCQERIKSVFGRYAVSIEGFQPGHPEFNLDDMPIHIPNGTRLSMGHIGCTNGHRMILRRFLETNDSFAIVIEDDAAFCEWASFKHFQESENRLSNLDSDWDWMNLFPPSFITPNPEWITGTDRLDNIFRCCSASVGSHCYMVSRKGAVKLLERSNVSTQPWDLYMIDCHNAHVYQGPHLAYVPPCNSEYFSIIETSEIFS